MNPLADLTQALTPQVETATKLTFVRINTKAEEEGDALSVMFNPGELTFARNAQFADVAIPGLPLPISQFVRGDAETLSMELTFDSTDGGMGEEAVSVNDMVHAFHQFVQVDGDKHSTPLVRVKWGDGFPGNAYSNAAEPEKHFDAIVLSVGRRFNLFSATGTPLRAVVSLSLKEYVPLEKQLAALNFRSPDHTRTHVVQEGETLPLIAYDAYGDVRQWPVIAETNDISNVRRVDPGTVLTLPPVR